MSYNEKIIANIHSILKKKKMTLKELSEKLNLGNSALSTKFGRVGNGGTMTLKSLIEIAEGLGVEPWELLK